MTAKVEATDNLLSSESEEDEIDYSILDLSFSNSNNESVIEQEVLNTQQIFDIMKNQVKKVLDVTKLRANEVRAHLNNFKWDSEKLIETLFKDGNLNMLKTSWKTVPCDIRKSFDCEICFETIQNPERILKFPCNNRFCVDCLLKYVTQTIVEAGGLLINAINCPGHKCTFELEDETVLRFLKDSSLKTKYQQIIANCFVQNNRLIQWCPNASCENAVRLEYCPDVVFDFDGESVHYLESVRCSCRYWFCFLCHCDSHDPVPCKMLAKWTRVRKEDFEAQQWILKHTKPCPSCRTNIQKDGGCMHMTCSKCRHQFCWVCMGLWSSRHNCGNQTEHRPDDFKYVRRFADYNAKHETMQQAHSLDVKNYKHMMVGGTELELDTQWIKLEFVAEAVETLLQCRRTLMHSYIFSYFITTIDNQMFIFEENLKFLEQSTEQLSELLENDITQKSVAKMKSKIIDGSSFCSKRRRYLLDHINEGYDKNWWKKFPISPEHLAAAELDIGEEAFRQLLY